MSSGILIESEIKKNTFLPDGVPNHIYSFAEKYGLKECGMQLQLCSILNVISISSLIEVLNFFIQRICCYRNTA